MYCSTSCYLQRDPGASDDGMLAVPSPAQPGREAIVQREISGLRERTNDGNSWTESVGFSGLRCSQPIWMALHQASCANGSQA